MYLVCIAVAVAEGANTTLPVTYPGQVLQGDGSQTCHSVEQRERVRNEVDNATLSLLHESVVHLLHTQLPTQPPPEHPCGGSGWRRVAYLNMSDPSQQCPSVWQEITTPHRVCGRRSSSASCEGLTYSTGSEQYGQVCGRIIGYQLGSPDAFRGSWLSINTSYVDGISVTHGFPRQHIWTFAAGVHEHMTYNWSTCPCVAGSTNEIRNYIPSFVGQSYFCETGLTQWNITDGIFWPDGDPLWDGQGCGPTSSCCTFNSPPWFNAQLPSSTTDDIEVRICSDHGIAIKDSPIQLMELYVK